MPSQQRHTRVCVTTYRSLSPQTLAVATDSLTLKHTSARQHMYDVVACASATHRQLCAHAIRNTTQATASATTDSLLLQHTCVRAVTAHGLGSLARRKHARTRARVCVCVCMCVCARRNDTQPSHNSTPFRNAHVCTRLQHTSVQSNTFEHRTKSSMRNQATGIVTTGSLLLQHTCVCVHTAPELAAHTFATHMHAS